MSNDNPKLRFAIGATVAGGLAFGAAASAAHADPFQVAELESGYMVADSHMGEEGKCGGKDKAKEGECAGEDKAKEGECAGEDKAKEGECAAKDKSEKKGGEGKCGEGKCAGA